MTPFASSQFDSGYLTGCHVLCGVGQRLAVIGKARPESKDVPRADVDAPAAVGAMRRQDNRADAIVRALERGPDYQRLWAHRVAIGAIVALFAPHRDDAQRAECGYRAVEGPDRAQAATPGAFGDEQIEKKHRD